MTNYSIEPYARKEDATTIQPVSPELITPQDIIAGKLDPELKAIARAIARYAKPIFWFYHNEPFLQFGGYGPDGTWPRPLCDRFPKQCDRARMFGNPKRPDGPERFIAFARHIHDVVEGEIRSAGKRSPIVWVMAALSMGEQNVPGFYSEYYPGNAYVDWHAFNWYPLEKDGASIGRYESISVSSGWKDAMALAPRKPVLIREFGVSSLEGDRSSWFEAFYKDVRTNSAMKNLAGFLYWQEGQRSQAGPSIRTRIPLAVDAETVRKAWQGELAAHPDYWHSDLRLR